MIICRLFASNIQKHGIFRLIANSCNNKTMTRLNTYCKSIFSVHRESIVCLFLVIMTLSVYWQLRNYDFVNFDDSEYVYENRQVQGGFTFENIKWAFTTIHMCNWHPLTWLSHMLDYQLYGLNPGAHHITNLLFHITNSLLLFIVFRKMTGHFWQSAFLSSLFALHPLHVESVAWISERKDVLSAFFWILTMWSYVWYVQHPRIDKYLLVLLLFVLGLMSKPMLVTLPFVLLLLDYYPLNRFRKSADINNSLKNSTVYRLVLEKIPLFVIVVISSAMTYYAQKHGGAVVPLDDISIQARMANALVSYSVYILKMLYPFMLAVLYPHPVNFPWWQITGACFLLFFISFSAIRVVNKRPYFIIGWLWYLGTLVPVIGLVQVGNQSMADRYTYIPLIGLFFIISWGIPEIAQRWRNYKKILTIIATISLTILIPVTYIQAGYWKNSITLYEHTIKVTENNYIACNNLGNAYKQQGLEDKAIKQYEKALRIKPDYAKAQSNLGDVYIEQGLKDKAIKQYEKALCINPDYAIAYNNLGNIYEEQGLFDDAIKHYEKAIRIDPDYVDAHYNLGNTYKKQGLFDDAIKQYKEALKIKPEYMQAQNNLGVTLLQKGDTDGAIKQFQKALQINPGNINAKMNLNKLCKSSRCKQTLEK
jgi:protein O-mannosyl-transferase